MHDETTQILRDIDSSLLKLSKAITRLARPSECEVNAEFFDKEELELISSAVRNDLKQRYREKEQEEILEEVQHKIWKVLQKVEKYEET